jgi:hypothetical protein
VADESRMTDAQKKLLEQHYRYLAEERAERRMRAMGYEF